jgi:hypothetical protein
MRFKVKEEGGKYYVYDSHNAEADPVECESLSEAQGKASALSFDTGETNSTRKHPEAE